MDRAVLRLLPSVSSVVVLFLLLLLPPARVSGNRDLQQQQPQLHEELEQAPDYKDFDDQWEEVSPEPPLALQSDDGPAEGPSADAAMGDDDMGADDFSDSTTESPSPEPRPWSGRAQLKQVKLAQNKGSGTTYFKPIALGLLVITAMASGLVAGAFGGLFFLRILRKK